MKSRISTLALMLFVGLLSAPGLSTEPLCVDFEQGQDLSDYQQLDCGSLETAIVSGGMTDGGYCLRIHNSTPATSCGVLLKGPFKLARNLMLSFDFRTAIEPGFEGAYLGMIFYVGGTQWFWHSDTFSTEWRHAEVPLGSLKPWQGHEVRPGLIFSGIRLYGRVKEETSANEETKARMTVHFDNIRVAVSQRQSILTDRTRVSTADPPMFQWSRLDATSGQRLQYSKDPGFPSDDTTIVDTKWNFFTPAEPLQPGTWYWRVWSSNELLEGWSDIERIDVAPDAHQFTTEATPLETLSSTPHPRLLNVARLTETNVTDARKAQLIKQAEKLYKQGVPEHPGPHVPGDPRWPTWIDWYGKVAGGITGGTGRRLERLASYAMLTGDPQVTEWAKELALEACAWDPEGGSAMRRGDIGAHHLLRGLNWCYDACCDTMSPEERQRLRGTIVQRAEQFHGRLNPFGGSEANNHAWLQALGLAESGIVLLGEHDGAAQWTELARQLYVGRFLSCLGRQGENNEGIAYWGYGLGFIVGYADMMKAVCGIDLYRHPWLRQTARFPMYTAPPGAWAVSFADTGKPNHAVRGPSQTRWVRALALRTKDPYALWYAGEREPVDGLAPQAPTNLTPSIHYRHIGWVIFNTSLVDGGEGATAALHSGRYFAGHQHPDQNSFVIHAYGEKLAIDGGYYDWWGSPHFDAYSMTTLAHNTLLVDGAGQAVRKPGADGRITSYFDSPGYGYTVGDASEPAIYQHRLSQFERRVLFIKPSLVVIHDLVASAQEAARYDWMIHAIAPIEAGNPGDSFQISCPRAALRGKFLAPTGVRLKVTTGFPVEPVDGYSTRPVPKEEYFPEWHLYATPRDPAGAEEFLVAMQIRRCGEQAEPDASIESVDAANAHGVRIRSGNSTHLLLLRKPQATGRLHCDGLETDGQLAAIEIDADENILRALAISAQELLYQGRSLLDGDTEQNWAFPEKSRP